MRPGRLNIRQQAFCEYYATPGEESFGNARKAAERAGYSRHTAGAQGGRLLRKAAVQ